MAGLGNPGRPYERTRHNVGFRVVDEIARRLGAPRWKNKDGAAQAHVVAARVLLLKPLSYMNESGGPIAAAAAWWKVCAENVLIVSDDLDLPFGRLRMRASGGSGGHNGLKSVIAHVGEGFPRLRIGIGRGRSDAIDYVLSSFTAEEEHELPAFVDVAAEGVERWLGSETSNAIQYVNAWRWPSPQSGEEPPRAS
ncbi:MAG: aminoacyl-tRNA hydrolase [Candidatus Eremiobacteraeota bacterium]|nr:aminoacyl-tRNA hydrolase [Candidatus Eremiobacteraeota bacterium]